MTRALVIINGDDVFEPLFPAGQLLLELATRCALATRLRYGMGVLDTDAADRAAVFVLYTARGTFTSHQQQRLADLVAAGRGLVAVHASNVFDAADEIAYELVGSRYESHGPEPRWSTFGAQLDQDHPITAGIDDFELYHEHYRLSMHPSGARVLGWRDSDTDRQPLLTVRAHGAGRVAYLQLGHDERSLGHPPVQRLIERAIGWATGQGSQAR